MNHNTKGLRAPHWAALAVGLGLGLSGLAACQTVSSIVPGPAATGQILDAAKSIPVGKSPHGIAAAQAFVYNSDVGAKQISVVDVAKDEVVKTIAFGPDGTPGYLYAIRGGTHVLGTDTAKGELFLLEAGTHEILWRLAVGTKPDKIVAAADGSKAWVSLVGEPFVVEVNLPADAKSPGSIARKLNLGSGAGSDHRALALKGGWLISPSAGANQVNLFELAKGDAGQAVEARLNPGPVGLSAPEGGVATAALVGLAASHELLHISLPGLQSTRLGNLGQAPSDIAMDPVTQRAFVTMSGSNEVAVVDMVSAKLLARIAVGDRPVHTYLAPALPPAAYRLTHDGVDHGASGTANPHPEGPASGSLAASGAASPATTGHGDAMATATGHGDTAASPTPTPLPASPVPTVAPGAAGADGGAEIWVSNDRGTTVSIIDARSLRVKATLNVGKGHRKMAFVGAKAYISNITDNTLSVIDRRAIR